MICPPAICPPAICQPARQPRSPGLPRLPRKGASACAIAALANAALVGGALVVGALAEGGPVAAQQAPGSYQLPPPAPAATPRPAGPADERAGVAIPPRAPPPPRTEPPRTEPPRTGPPRTGPPLTASPGNGSAAGPGADPGAAPNAPATALSRQGAAPGASSRPARAPMGTPAPRANAAPPAAPPAADPATDPAALRPPGDSLTGLPPAGSVAEPPAGTPRADTPAAADTAAPASIAVALAGWWPLAAGVLAAAAALAIALLLRRRQPKVRRLAPPAAATSAAGPAEPGPCAELPRLDLTLDITGATRSVMMFTLHYRLTIANRTPRAASDLSLAAQIACARRGAGNGASPGAAQALAQIERIGPHQSRTVTGTVQLPLADITVLQHSARPLFIPLVHVTVEGAGHSALARSFVIGTPSASAAGRLHPIVLDGPPGALPDLRAQPVDIPAAGAAGAGAGEAA